MRTSRSKEPAKPPHSPVSTSREGSKGAQRLKQSPAPGQKPKKKAASRAVPKPDTQVQALLKELLAQSAQTEQNVKALAGMLQAFMASVATAVPGVQSSGVSLQPGSWQTVLRVESVGTQTSRRKKQDSEQSESEESEEEPSEDEEEEDGEEGEEEGEERESEEEEQEEDELSEEESKEEDSDPPLKSPQIRLLPPDSPSVPAAKRKKSKHKARK